MVHIAVYRREKHKTTIAVCIQFTYRFIKNETSKRPLCSFRPVAYGPVKSLCVLHGVTVKGILRRVS